MIDRNVRKGDANGLGEILERFFFSDPESMSAVVAHHLRDLTAAGDPGAKDKSVQAAYMRYWPEAVDHNAEGSNPTVLGVILSRTATGAGTFHVDYGAFPRDIEPVQTDASGCGVAVLAFPGSDGDDPQQLAEAAMARAACALDFDAEDWDGDGSDEGDGPAEGGGPDRVEHLGAAPLDGFAQFLMDMETRYEEVFAANVDGDPPIAFLFALRSVDPGDVSPKVRVSLISGENLVGSGPLTEIGFVSWLPEGAVAILPGVHPRSFAHRAFVRMADALVRHLAASPAWEMVDDLGEDADAARAWLFDGE